MSSLQLIVGSGNKVLGERIRELLNLEKRKDLIGRFIDDEVRVELDNVREADLFIFTSTQPPAENLIELALLIDAAKRASAKQINVVISYFGYARQDRKDKSRVPISAKVVATIIEKIGAHRVICLDLHSGQEQGFFEIPVDHLYARPVFVETLQDLRTEQKLELVLFGPDANAMKLVESYAKRLDGVGVAFAHKTRKESDRVADMKLIGEVEGGDVVIIDDMVATAGTIEKATQLLLAQGARTIRVLATHGVFSGQASELIQKLPIVQVIVTNSLPISQRKVELLGPKLQVVDIAPLMAKAIQHIHEGRSVSSLINAEEEA